MFEMIIGVPFLIGFLLFLAISMLLPFIFWPKNRAFGFYCILLLIYIPLACVFPGTFSQPNFATYAMTLPIGMFWLTGWVQWLVTPKGQR